MAARLLACAPNGAVASEARAIVLSALVPLAIAPFVKIVRVIGHVAHALRGMVHSAIKENSVAGPQRGGAEGISVLSQRPNRVQVIVSRKLWRVRDFARGVMQRRGFLKAAL